MDTPQERNFEELLIEELQAPAVEFDGSFQEASDTSSKPKSVYATAAILHKSTVLFCRSEQAFSFLSKR